MAQTRSNTSIMLLILVLGFALGYLIYSQYIGPSETPVNPPPVAAIDDLKAFKDISINFSVLENAKFKSLITFGESPVKPGVTGKRDIFAPF